MVALESTLVSGARMKVAVEEVSSCKRKLQVEEGPDVVRAAWQKAFSRVQKEARLPGFRKGKVPSSMIKLHFADEVRQEVARRLIPEIYRQALAETQIKPVEEPDLQQVSLEEDAPLKFEAVVEIKPAITLGQYTGLSDYTLTPEGMDVRHEKGYGFVIGSGGVMPEIEEAVIGLSAGGERTVNVRFPDAHQMESLRGKSGVAHVKVNEVKEKILPPLDDELAKTVGQVDTLDALKAEARKGLQTRRESENRRALEEAVTDALLAIHPIEVPEALVLRQVGHLIEHTKERMRRQGMDPEKLPWDYGKLLQELRPGAEKAVRRALILEAIAEKEGLNPSEADIEAEIEKIALANNRPAPAVKRMMDQSGDLAGLRHSLGEARTMEFLISKASVAA